MLGQLTHRQYCSNLNSCEYIYKMILKSLFLLHCFHNGFIFGSIAIFILANTKLYLY